MTEYHALIAKEKLTWRELELRTWEKSVLRHYARRIDPRWCPTRLAWMEMRYVLARHAKPGISPCDFAKQLIGECNAQQQS